MKKLVLLIASIMCVTLCFSQTENYPIIEKNGKRYYEYTILQGDGLFAIARKFGIKQSDLHDANENLTTDIKAGSKILILIPENNTKNINQAVTTHVVEPKQTLYSISKMYNVAIDTLIALNPSAKTGIKVGETLIISQNKNIQQQPTQQQPIAESKTEDIQLHKTNITHEVKRKETLFSISKKYNVAIHDLISLNPELKDGLKAGTTIIIKGDIEGNDKINRIEINTPTPETQKSEEKNETTTTIPVETIWHKKEANSSQLNIAYLLPLVAENSNDVKNTQRFVEFYRGSILALNDAKKDGLSANIYAYNLPKNIDKIDSVLHLLDNKDIDIVIGPAYSEQLNKVLAYTKSHDIATIVPFSNKIDSEYYFPKLIQFNPPQDSLFRLVLRNTFEHRNLQYILARFENCTNKGNTFINDLAGLLNANNKEFKEVIIKPENVDSIVKTVTSDTTILILGSSRINDVAPILDSLNLYKLQQLQVWGFEEWGNNLIKKYPQTLYYSLFYPNETEAYKADYKNWFGVRKQTVGVKYDLLGYDLTMLALKGITITDESTLLIKNTPINFLQSEPKLEFIDNHWLNTNYYLLFWDNITIKTKN
jgi:LysM repeat protein